MKKKEHVQTSSWASSEIGLYVHVPYCLQECHYCDFVKFEVSKLPPIEDYFNLLKQELKTFLNNTGGNIKFKTLYFGGGTPSLTPLRVLEDFMAHLDLSRAKEITLEINPGTLSKNDVLNLKKMGVNRFSLGVQTFNPTHLKACQRKHSPQDALNDLKLFCDLDLNFSVDLLFGLPNQDLSQLQADLDVLSEFSPPHLSAYNLTLPEQHAFNQNRASDKAQIKMLEHISQASQNWGLQRYEISNFARPGHEAIHNALYWNDHNYLGLGLGAHSYFKSEPWGTRFWNTSSYKHYTRCVHDTMRPHLKSEHLKTHEALTDFCHTSMRQLRGLSLENLEKKFKEHLPKLLWHTLSELEQKDLVLFKQGHWRLSSKGLNLPNEVFKALCFLESDLTPS